MRLTALTFAQRHAARALRAQPGADLLTAGPAPDRRFPLAVGSLSGLAVLVSASDPAVSPAVPAMILTSTWAALRLRRVLAETPLPVSHRDVWWIEADPGELAYAVTELVDGDRWRLVAWCATPGTTLGARVLAAARLDAELRGRRLDVSRAGPAGFEAA